MSMVRPSTKQGVRHSGTLTLDSTAPPPNPNRPGHKSLSKPQVRFQITAEIAGEIIDHWSNHGSNFTSLYKE